MSWVCPNCSTSNDDTAEECFVCGTERSEAERTAATGETAAGKIVFSDFQAFKESLKRIFGKKRREKEPVFDIEEIPDDTRSIPPETERPERKTPKPKEIKAHRAASGFAPPWPEHDIEFDIDAIKSKGYVRSEQEMSEDIKGYRFYHADGSDRFIRKETALLIKLAKKR